MFEDQGWERGLKNVRTGGVTNLGGGAGVTFAGGGGGY